MARFAMISAMIRTDPDVDEAAGSTTIMAQLEELIIALERGIPYAARAGERKIAHDAASLRNAAVARLAQLAAADRDPHATRPVRYVAREGDIRRASGGQRDQDSVFSVVPAYDD